MSLTFIFFELGVTNRIFDVDLYDTAFIKKQIKY